MLVPLDERRQRPEAVAYISVQEDPGLRSDRMREQQFPTAELERERRPADPARERDAAGPVVVIRAGGFPVRRRDVDFATPGVADHPRRLRKRPEVDPRLCEPEACVQQAGLPIRLDSGSGKADLAEPVGIREMLVAPIPGGRPDGAQVELARAG